MCWTDTMTAKAHFSHGSALSILGMYIFCRQMKTSFGSCAYLLPPTCVSFSETTCMLFEIEAEQCWYSSVLHMWAQQPYSNQNFLTYNVNELTGQYLSFFALRNHACVSLEKAKDKARGPCRYAMYLSKVMPQKKKERKDGAVSRESNREQVPSKCIICIYKDGIQNPLVYTINIH